MNAVYIPAIPSEMMASPVDEYGWFEWKLLDGLLQQQDYEKLEKQYGIKLPQSFINWHKRYFFLDADCLIFRLPASIPSQPLKQIRNNLEWFIPKQIIPQKIYPFGDSANDIGPLVFDARIPMPDNEFPIRSYDHEYGGDLAGLSEIIFSSFDKLLECVTYFLNGIGNKEWAEIIPFFFEIDPDGAGKTGREYWKLMADC